MHMLRSASIGLALAVSALAFCATSASAIVTQTPGAHATTSGVTEVSWRCTLWAHRCRQRYPAGGWRFHRCMALHACR